MNSAQQVVLHSQSPLPNVQQNIRQGDLLFVRVMKNLGGGNYLASFAGGRFTVKSAAGLMAGQTFRSRVEIAGGKLFLVPQMQGAASAPAAISVQNFNALSGEVAAFLASMGLEADGVAQRILQFMMQSGAKINPSLMQKVRRLASKYKGRESEAAEAALILEQKGIDSEEALDEIMNLLQGEGYREKGTGEDSGNRQQKNRQDSEFQEQQGLSYRATAQAPQGSRDEEQRKDDSVLAAFNRLPQRNTESPKSVWLLLPFEFENQETGGGSGVLRLFLNTEENITEKFIINFNFDGENLFFAVYFKDKQVGKIEFSGRTQKLDSNALKAGFEALAASLGSNVEARIVPPEEFSKFAVENLPFYAVEGFA